MNQRSGFNWTGWSSFIVVLLLWEIGARLASGQQVYLPRMTSVIAALAQLAISGAVGGHLLATLERFLTGYLIAAALGITLGIVLGYFQRWHDFLGIVIELLRPMPSVAIIPVAILSLGIGDSMIVAVTVYASIWSILINTIDGVRNIESTLVNTGRTFRLSRRRILWQIILPGAAPYIVTGLRIALSIALILVTTAEMIAASKGLGFYILDQERSMNSANMYAGIIIVAALGYALNRSFVAVEARALKWRHGMMARQAI
ncbi:MAG TPA: ABC transporter permease [Candidatus Binatia bacterium]|nr:ABC transporter permease [Candidatus Binatia bacterium]